MSSETQNDAGTTMVHQNNVVDNESNELKDNSNVVIADSVSVILFVPSNCLYKELTINLIQVVCLQTSFQ